MVEGIAVGAQDVFCVFSQSAERAKTSAGRLNDVGGELASDSFGDGASAGIADADEEDAEPGPLRHSNIVALVNAKSGKKRKKKRRARGEETLVICREGVELVTLNVDEAHDTPFWTENRNDDFRARGTKSGEPTGIVLNIANIDDLAFGDRSAAEALSGRECRKRGRSLAGAGDHGNLRFADSVETDPAVIAFESYGFSDLFEPLGTAAGLPDDGL